MKNKNAKGIVARALVLILVISALSVVFGCPPPPPLRFRSGYADYWVEFYDYVYDRYGYVAEAYCANFTAFYGDIDWDCTRYPMVWSYAEYNWMSCTYVDAYGATRYFEDLYYFYPGYIQDAPCSSGYSYPDPPDNTSIHSASTLDRNADNQLVLSDDVELGDVDVDLDDLRQRLLEDEDLRAELLDRLRQYIEENGIPDGLEPEPSVMRLNEPTEGDPPADYGTER